MDRRMSLLWFARRKEINMRSEEELDQLIKIHEQKMSELKILRAKLKSAYPYQLLQLEKHIAAMREKYPTHWLFEHETNFTDKG